MTDSLKQQIRNAFCDARYPGDECLRNSNEGDEPFLLEQEFQGKTDWRALDYGFIDRAPDGFGSALSFYSDEAMLFYLPAYLIADIDGLLNQSDPVFHLVHGLDDHSGATPINPRRYGHRTWLDYSSQRFSAFSAVQCAAIAAYLRFRCDTAMDFQAVSIHQALRNYWDPRSHRPDGTA